MPYDPQPVSQGGNRGIDEEFSRQAPKGKYRVVGVDTFDGGDWHKGDYATLAAAKKVADKHGAQMTIYYVYDSKGCCVHRAGTF